MYREALKTVTPREAGRGDRPDEVTVFIETPTGSRDKFDLDHESGLLRWSLQLPLGLSFPFAFGFVPNTLAADGDPLDIILLVDGVIPPGTLVGSRLIGVLPVEQDDSGDGAADTRNDRILAIPTLAQTYADTTDVSQLRDGMVEEIGRFFGRYNQMIGRDFTFGDALGADEAYERLDAAVDRAGSE
ncbi:MAG: inorganic diphosphatase [Pontixanthobacter sp.]